jgi:ABC-type molybdate transport system substrate-binding protein
MRRRARRVALVAVAAQLPWWRSVPRGPVGKNRDVGDITVFAAASLRVPFTRIGRGSKVPTRSAGQP